MGGLMGRIARKVDYRAYLMDVKGHIADVRLIQASDDRSAWEAAVDREEYAGVELWCRDREVMPQWGRQRRRELARPG